MAVRGIAPSVRFRTMSPRPAFAGGTDTGVMKLVADAVHTHNVDNVPVIGVVPLGCVNGKEQLTDCQGKTVR